MRPVIIPFKAEHVYQMKPRESVQIEQIAERLPILSRLGPAYTALAGEKVIGCGGIVRLWPGVGEAWTIFSDDICGCRIWVHRTVQAIIQTAMNNMGLHRLQAVAKDASERNCRWLESLRFAYEGQLNAFGHDGEDFARYAIVVRKTEG